MRCEIVSNLIFHLALVRIEDLFADWECYCQHNYGPDNTTRAMKVLLTENMWKPRSWLMNISVGENLTNDIWSKLTE